jgi:phenylacetate-CoA ligase
MYGADKLLFLETDASGELLVTSLYNSAFPFIRYRLGDKVELTKEAGTGRTIIRNILGRSDDLIRLPDGGAAAGLTVYYLSRNLMTKMSAVKEVYVTQTELTSFRLFYVGDQLTSREQLVIRDCFDQYLQPGLNLEIVKTDYIRRRANGKLQMFHSELTM